MPEDNDVLPSDACPVCLEKDADNLIWQEDGETVQCCKCGAAYQPGSEAGHN